MARVLARGAQVDPQHAGRGHGRDAIRRGTRAFQPRELRARRAARSLEERDRVDLAVSRREALGQRALAHRRDVGRGGASPATDLRLDHMPPELQLAPERTLIGVAHGSGYT